MHNCMTNSPSYGHTDMRYMKYAHTFLPSRTTFISCRDEDYCRQKMKAIPVLIRHSCLTSGQSPAATRTRARRVFTHYGQRRPSNPMPRVAKWHKPRPSLNHHILKAWDFLVIIFISSFCNQIYKQPSDFSAQMLHSVKMDRSLL